MLYLDITQMRHYILIIQVYIMMKASAYMITSRVFATYQANINPQRSNSKKLKKTTRDEHNWYNKQVCYILQEDYHTYTSYIINCNSHKILSMNGYVVFVIISYLLIFHVFFIYLSQSGFVQAKVCKYMKNRWKIKRYDMITKRT